MLGFRNPHPLRRSERRLNRSPPWTGRTERAGSRLFTPARFWEKLGALSSTTPPAPWLEGATGDRWLFDACEPGA